MNRKKHVTVLMMVAVLIAVYVIQWSFFDIRRIKGQEVLQEALSPDGTAVVINDVELDVRKDSYDYRRD